MTNRIVINKVASTSPPSPKTEIAKEVATAEAMTFTRLLPIKIEPIRVSLSCRSFSTICAFLFPLRAICLMRASEAAVSAVSALEKKAENRTSRIIAAISSIIICTIMIALPKR